MAEFLTPHDRSWGFGTVTFRSFGLTKDAKAKRSLQLGFGKVSVMVKMAEAHNDVPKWHLGKWNLRPTPA